MTEGAVAEKTVLLYNTSNAPLRVERVAASCGCTTTRAPKEIPAHGSAPLTVYFDSHNRAGPIRQSVQLFLANDAGSLTVPTTGEVARDVVFSARSLDLGNGTSSTPAALTITRVDGKPLSVSAEAPRLLRARLEQVASNSARLSVSLAAPTLAGMHQEKVALRLNQPGLPVVAIPVTWTTPGAFLVTPGQVNFGIAYPDSLEKEQVSVSGADVSRLRVLSSEKGVTAFLRRANSGTATLTVSWLPKGGEGSLLRAQVVLATGNARQPRIVIPIYAAVSAADGTCSVP